MNNLTDAVNRASWTCKRFSTAQDRRTDGSHFSWLFQEGVHKVIHEFVGIINPVGELTDDPNHGCLGFWFVEKVQVFTECGDNSFILARVSTENVLNDDDRLLDYVRDFCLDEL